MKKSVLFVFAAVALAAGVAVAADMPTIGCAIYKFDDTFMTGVRNAILKTAEGKAKVEMVDSQNSQATQNDKVDLFITKKVKALAINPVDRSAAGVIIQKAKAAKIPVVFFIAQRAHVAPSTICDMRLQGESWMEISLHFGLGPEVYYVPVSEVYGDPYEQVYTYYREKPRTEWRTIRLSDDDIVNVVNLRFVSEQQGYDPPQVMKMRSEGKSFMKINEEVKARKHGRGDERGKKKGRD